MHSPFRLGLLPRHSVDNLITILKSSDEHRELTNQNILSHCDSHSKLGYTFPRGKIDASELTASLELNIADFNTNEAL